MKPILFNTEMVRAILEGRKTVTRRAVKPQPDSKHSHKLGYVVVGDKKEIGCFGFGTNECGGSIQYAKPPYQVNDILYVRETWSEDKHNFIYKADYTQAEERRLKELLRWKPSIHMPKEAARIFLRVTDVRVERLQKMTFKDFLAEGINNLCDSCNKFPFNECDTCGREAYANMNFIALWDSNIKRDQLNTYGWVANPFVWVIEFEVISKSEALGGSSPEG